MMFKGPRKGSQKQLKLMLFYQMTNRELTMIILLHLRLSKISIKTLNIGNLNIHGKIQNSILTLITSVDQTLTLKMALILLAMVNLRVLQEILMVLIFPHFKTLILRFLLRLSRALIMGLKHFLISIWSLDRLLSKWLNKYSKMSSMMT